MQNNVNLAPGCSTSGQHKCEMCPSQFPLKEDLIVHQLLFHSYSTSQLADKDGGMNIQRRPIHHPAEVRSATHPSSFPSPGLTNYQSSWGHNARTYPSPSVRSPNLPYSAHNFGFAASRDRQVQATVNLVHGSQGTGQYKCDRCSCQFQVREDLVVHQILCHQANPAMPYQRPPSVETQRVPTSVENQPSIPPRHPPTDMGLGYRDTRNPYYFGSGFAYVPGSYPKEGYGPAGMGNINTVMAPPPPLPPPPAPSHSPGVNNFAGRSNVSPVTSHHELTHMDHSMPVYTGSGPLGHPPEALDLSYSESDFQKHPDPPARRLINPGRPHPNLPYQERTYQQDNEAIARSNMNSGKGYGLTYVHVNITEDTDNSGRSNVSPLGEHHLSNQQRAMAAGHMNQEKEQEHEMQMERPVLQLIGEQRTQNMTNERDQSVINHRADILAPHRGGDMTATTQRHNDIAIATQRHHHHHHHHHHNMEATHPGSTSNVPREQQQINMNIPNNNNMPKPVDVSIPYKHRNRDDSNFATSHRKHHEVSNEHESGKHKKKKSKNKHHSKSQDHWNSRVPPAQEVAMKKTPNSSVAHQGSSKKHKRSHSVEKQPLQKVVPPVTQSIASKNVYQSRTIPPTTTTSVTSGNVTQMQGGKQMHVSTDPRKRWQNFQQKQPPPQMQGSTVKQAAVSEKDQGVTKDVKVEAEKRKSPETVQAVIEEKLKNKEDSVDLAKGEGTGPHKCEKCGSGFRMKADLDMHLLVFHSLKKPTEPISKLKPKTPDQMEKIKQTTMKKTVDDILRMLPNKKKTGGVKGEVKVVSVSYRCQTCDVSFMTIVGLEEHQYVNHKCRTCEFIFDNKEQLQRHKIIAHMCGQCGHYFQKNESRKDHPCQDNVCTICGEILESREKLLEHNAENHKCSGCRASFLHKSDLEKHRLDKHGHRCDICGYHFKWKEGLKQHILSSHGMKCVTCKARFTTKEELDEHVMENHKCNICSLFFKTAESLQKHKDFIHICQMCGKVFKERDKLTKHQYESHRCSLCNEMFKLKTELEQHRKTIHKCCFCGVLFDSKQIQDNHPCETYKCPCGANYETEDELELHSENNHFCTYCDTFFLMKDEFRIHRSTNHRCGICDAHYIQKANLDKHKESDHKCKKCGAKPDFEKKDPSVCSCGENFKNGIIQGCQPSADAVKVNSNGTEAPALKEDEAADKLSAKTELQLEGPTTATISKTDPALAPLSVVIKEKIYCGDEEISKECEFCDKLFPDGKELEKHLKICPDKILRTHLIATRTAAGLKENSIVKANNSRTLPVIKLSCSHGELEFSSREAMEKHMRELHPGYAKTDGVEAPERKIKDEDEQGGDNKGEN